MGSQSWLKYIYPALALVMIDAAISLGLVSSMVAFLHGRGGGAFEVVGSAGSNILLRGEPANLLVDQGHTTNGAGGTGLVLVGFGGIIALFLENRSRKKSGKSSKAFYVWSLIVFLNWLLTLAALIFVFVVTSQTANQTIDLDVVAQNQFPSKYPNGQWTPENWYNSMLALPLVSDSDRGIINQNLSLMRGWRYNLIPFFILGFVLVNLVVLEVLNIRKPGGSKYARTGQEEVYGDDAK